jgi:hypothetical protein
MRIWMKMDRRREMAVRVSWSQEYPDVVELAKRASRECDTAAEADRRFWGAMEDAGLANEFSVAGCTVSFADVPDEEV